MPAIESKIDVSGDAFQRNRAGMLKLIERLRALEALRRDESAKAQPLFDKRGPGKRLQRGAHDRCCARG